MAPDPLPDLRRGARDVVYTGVGLGILGFQQLQVTRRELEKALGVELQPPTVVVSRLVGRVTRQG
jgi:hypothetical protein